jgi:hypothetical protein
MSIGSTTNTRAALRAALRDGLEDKLELLTQKVPSGEWEGVPVVTGKDLVDVIAEVFGGEMPPPDGQSAEVRTPATVYVSADCPRCHIPGIIPLTITPELRVEPTSSELRLHAKAKARLHMCGQTVLPVEPEVEGQTAAFDIDDIVGEPDADDMLTTDRDVDEESDIVEPDGEGPVATAAPERIPHRGDRVTIDGQAGTLTAFLSDGTMSARFGRRVRIIEEALEWHADADTLHGGYWSPAPAEPDDDLLP